MKARIATLTLLVLLLTGGVLFAGDRSNDPQWAWKYNKDKTPAAGIDAKGQFTWKWRKGYTVKAQWVKSRKRKAKAQITVEPKPVKK